MPRNRPRTTAKAAWSDQDLINAKDAIQGGMSKRKAAITFKIPFSTLRERLMNDKLVNPQLGRKPVFTIDQEIEIAEQVKLLGSLYYGLTITDLRKLVYKYADMNGIKNNFDKNSQTAGPDWVKAFMKRNPSVALRKAEATSLNRVSAFNKEEITCFFNILGDLMEKHKFLPNNMYNADETGVTTVTDPGKVLAEKGQRRVGAVTSGERGRNITVMCAMSAAGNFIPPMFIFPRQRMTPLLEKDGPPGAIYTCSKNGWINEDLFVDWLKHFAAYAKPTLEQPILLILDNHSSHISLSAYNFCKKNHIVMLSIPPHSSHRTQPLDVSFYGPLKAAYRHECNRHMKTHLMAKITPYDVAALFNKAYAQVANISKGEAGFRATGIFPLNPNVFTEQDFLAASMMAENSDQPIEAVEAVEDNLPSDNVPARTHTITVNPRHVTPEPPPIAVPANTVQSPVPGPSNDPRYRYQSPVPDPQLPVPASQFVEQSQTSMNFADIAATPRLQPSLPTQRRTRRQHATILTSTPLKAVLEEKENKKNTKKNKIVEQNKQKRGSRKTKQDSNTAKVTVLQNKNINKKAKTSKTQKAAKGKKIQGKGYKRKVLQETSSESESEPNSLICNDNSDDEMDDEGKTDNMCNLCKEFGQNNEVWYRCTICGLWSHAMCSGWDSAEGYICDFCS